MSETKTIILASKSPRRKKLLEQLGISFSIDVSNIKETIDKKLPPFKIAENLSLQKAEDVAKRHKNAIIIAADTLVFFENKIFGKPHTEKNTKKMLKMLSGKPHTIITGFTVLDTNSKKAITQSEATIVFMKRMTAKEIDLYVATKEPLDKAGGYGIQELGVMFIEKIQGDYNNIVGLPLFTLVEVLRKFNIFIL